jgi:hypothetical protein
VQDLKEAAERATDPNERRRLQDQARRLREQSKQADRRGEEDIDPM